MAAAGHPQRIDADNPTANAVLRDLRTEAGVKDAKHRSSDASLLAETQCKLNRLITCRGQHRRYNSIRSAFCGVLSGHCLII